MSESTAAADSNERDGLFGDVSLDAFEAQLAEAYQRAGRTLDDLPYTQDFDRLYAEVGVRSGLDQRGLLHKLQNLRKAGKLPRLGRGRSTPPTIEADEESALADIVSAAVGSLGQRDQLPYTVEFVNVVDRFNARVGRRLSPHDVWRLVAKIAK